MAHEDKPQQERLDAQKLAPGATRNRASDDEKMAPHKQIRLQRFSVDVDDDVFE